MNLKNKKVLFLGDSITAGAAASCEENVFHQILKEKLGMKEAINYGIGGTRIARQTKPSAEPVFDLDFNKRVEKMDKDADCVFIFGGTNDFGHGDAQLGNKNDETVYTFYGALKCLYEKLIKIYGKEKIIVMTPMHRLDEENLRGEGNKEKDMYILKTYVEVIKEVAGEYGLKIIDLFAERDLNPNYGENAKKYFSDVVHPNDAGHRLLAEIIEKKLINL